MGGPPLEGREGRRTALHFLASGGADVFATVADETTTRPLFALRHGRVRWRLPFLGRHVVRLGDRVPAAGGDPGRDHLALFDAETRAGDRPARARPWGHPPGRAPGRRLSRG
ncbi:hypothetical protein [Kitasatospora sp. NPDC091207]|uniref:hypothetical protein n=1 Tax=Kitasatospora sp. NPDC091207 TaxID=3364083 RepID=UPI0038022B7C